MQTVLSYRAAKWPSDSDKPRCSLVWAGHETQDFINLFPEWINNTEVSRVNKEVIVRGMSLHIMTADLFELTFYRSFVSQSFFIINF